MRDLNCKNCGGTNTKSVAAIQSQKMETKTRNTGVGVGPVLTTSGIGIAGGVYFGTSTSESSTLLMKELSPLNLPEKSLPISGTIPILMGGLFLAVIPFIFTPMLQKMIPIDIDQSTLVADPRMVINALNSNCYFAFVALIVFLLIIAQRYNGANKFEMIQGRLTRQYNAEVSIINQTLDDNYSKIMYCDKCNSIFIDANYLAANAENLKTLLCTGLSKEQNRMVKLSEVE